MMKSTYRLKTAENIKTTMIFVAFLKTFQIQKKRGLTTPTSKSLQITSWDISTYEKKIYLNKETVASK